MNPELEKFIDLALATGTLSEKGKQILYKKAKELNVDIDELELVLEGKLHLRQKEMQQSSNLDVATSSPPPLPIQQQSNKEGSIKKCPSCGASMGAFISKCKECGHEFRNVEASNSIKDLNKQLQDAAEKVRVEKEKMVVTWKNAHLKHPANIDKEISNLQVSIVTSFPILNTKEDILEFLATAVPQSNIEIRKFGPFNQIYPGEEGKVALKNAWRSKCEQIIMKARFLLKDDPKTLEDIEHYAKQLGIK
ncbi:MAG: hypothetical protein IPJ86_14945 [Bacteroidetes bacterium]|nr:hypothetical protein [Bacteroidota bacterium]